MTLKAGAGILLISVVQARRSRDLLYLIVLDTLKHTFVVIIGTGVRSKTRIETGHGAGLATFHAIVLIGFWFP